MNTRRGPFRGFPGPGLDKRNVTEDKISMVMFLQKGRSLKCEICRNIVVVKEAGRRRTGLPAGTK